MSERQLTSEYPTDSQDDRRKDGAVSTPLNAPEGIVNHAAEPKSATTGSAGGAGEKSE
jgi:hypothetical protein